MTRTKTVRLVVVFASLAFPAVQARNSFGAPPPADEAEPAPQSATESVERTERPRTWKDKSGDFSVQATLVSADEESVSLRKEDGTVIRVPIEQLSFNDRVYLKQRDKEPAPPTRPRPAKPDGEPEEKPLSEDELEKLRELETTLLTMQLAPPENVPWMTAWYKHLELGFLQPPNGKTVAVSMVNRTPCKITIKTDQLDGLTIDGKGKPDEPEGPWEVEPRARLLLAVAPKLKPVTIPNTAGGVVDTLTTFWLMDIEVEPTHTELPTMRVRVMTEVGTIGPRVVFARYLFELPGVGEAE